MKSFQDRACVSEIEQRLRRLSSTSTRQWGKMTADQMVCHLADAYQAHMGKRRVTDDSALFKRTVMKCVALYAPFPWPKGRIATVREVDPFRDGTSPSVFAVDVERLERSLTEFVEAASERRCAGHPLFGPLSPDQWLRFGYLHADHHLRQFGA